MKLPAIILLFGIFAVFPMAVYADAGEMTKKEAKSFLLDLMKDKIFGVLQIVYTLECIRLSRSSQTGCGSL